MKEIIRTWKKVCSMPRLSDLRAGERALVTQIFDDDMRTQALRFGIGLGAEVLVEQAIPWGPLVLRRGHQILALDRESASRIEVKRT